MRLRRIQRPSEARLRDCLDRVFKPSRYTGGEVNLILKDPRKRIRFGLVYPDLYDLGMANLSLKILYEVLNRIENVSAERSFLPDLDMQKEMARSGIGLWSLENRLLLRCFDFIGFTIQTELTATNILQCLKLSGVHPLRTRRGPSSPLVIAGGPTLANPEPYADFVDLFVIGDAEEVLPAMMSRYAESRTRREFFDKIRGFEGIYIPGEWKTERRSGRSVPVRGTRNPQDCGVTVSLVPDLDAAVFPTRQIVPLMNIPQDRAVLEVSRGCLNNCRFCQAGYFYRPLRERSLPVLERLAAEIVGSTGHSVISMLSLSISNYSNLAGLIGNLSRRFRKEKVTLSLPSLRIDAFNIDTLSQYRDVKKTGLTFALESMSPRVRRFLNKDLDMAAFREIVAAAAAKKWRHIKIYLMWGFPVEGEIDENIAGMLEFADFVRSLGQSVNLTFHLTPFIPKPGTPLQWLSQRQLPLLEADLLRFKREVRRKNVTLKWHDLRMARFESVLARAGRGIGRVIYRAWRKGAMFDAWDDKFNYGLWQPLLDRYEKSHPVAEDGPMPWDHIGFGYSKDFFRKEYDRSLAGTATADCDTGPCYDCGVCGERTGPDGDGRKARNVTHADQPGPPAAEEVLPAKRTDQDPFHLLELRFGKQGLARYLSHLDLVHLFEKALNISGLDIRMSFGFSPHKKMSLPFPLALGIESPGEILLVEVWNADDPSEAVRRMNAFLPADLAVVSARFIPDRSVIADARTAEFEIDLSPAAVSRAAYVREHLGVTRFERIGRSWVLGLAVERNVFRTLEESGIPRKAIRRVTKRTVLGSRGRPV